MKCGPCKGCEDRIIGCHATCERYMVWKEGLDLERELRKEQSNIAGQITSAFREKWFKWKRNHR